MRYSSNAGSMHPPDHATILIEQLHESQRDQTKMLHHLNNAQGWIIGRLQSGDQFHSEVKQEFAEVKKRLSVIEHRPAAETPPAKFNVIIDSISGLLHAGRPYVVCFALVGLKLLGHGPSLIEPLIKALAAAL